MISRNIQFCEVIVIVLDFRSFNDFVTHTGENALHFLECDRIRMTMSDKFHLGRKCDINFLSCKLFVKARCV